MKKIALIMLGVGGQDGSETTETVSASLSLSEFSTQTTFFSFDEEFACQNHQTRTLVPGVTRNALVESGRLTRGQSVSIEELNPDDFDALVLPGGSGVLKNLTTYATDGDKFKVHATLEKIILKFHQQSKPIGAICIAPVIAAQVLKKYKPLITLGETSDIIPRLEKMNIQHENCPSTDYITDRDCKLLTTPAYMNDDVTPHSVYTGIRLMIKELVEMA
jgi:enhancing lycopene biosynthesis protein 2